MNDSHGSTRSGALTQLRGEAGVGVSLGWIDERPVVLDVSASAFEAGLRPGDVVVSVDGEHVVDRADRLTRGVAASHEDAFRWRVNRWLLGGVDGSTALLMIERAGERLRLSLPRDGSDAERSTPVWGVLDSGVGYLDLKRLEAADVDEAWAAVASQAALVIDIRGYPRGTFFILGPKLAAQPALAARFERPEPRSPHPTSRPRLHFDQMVEPEGEAYQGEVAVLIDVRAISQSEHTCLWIEAAREGRVTFVGSRTNGANGDVTTIALPGGVFAFMTGQGVCHGDGRQLQRLGVLPDIEVQPTIAGLQAGRDEVLETAIVHLRAALNPNGGLAANTHI